MGKFVFVDSEINSKNQISDLGAIKDDGAEFHSANPRNFASFVSNCSVIVGHNIFRHDLKYLKQYLPNRCSVIDTLPWSPILFPNKPYHRLVKDDKIDNDDVNNPLSDSIKCKDLYYDEVSKFNTLPPKLRDIFGELLYRHSEFSGFLAAVNWSHRMFTNVKAMIRDYFRGMICCNANLDRLIRDYSAELAFSLALITAEDQKSITPGWVLHEYPKVEEVIHELRSKNCHDSRCSYCSKAFKAKEKLKEYFGYSDFRTFEGENLQEMAVNLALDRKSLLAIFPTGGGKSLTFQLPALIDGETIRGLTIVISPLQSLMKDQVDNLEKKTIVGAATINGLLSPVERSHNSELVRDGTASLLYIAPESLRSKTVEKLLLTREISRIVIDEAHCFSSWGQDFRVDYLFIADFIKNLQVKKNLSTNIPISCFTATAKPKVISDICSYFRTNLGVELNVLASSATRTNLKYKVLYMENENDKYSTLRELLIENKCPTIIYVARVKETETLAKKLSKDGIPAIPFNGQMERSDKIENQNLFMSNEVQVIVATSAFGMGVDKSDVKLVIHYDISDSLENYVQEAGRAGRDQSIQADCYVLYNENDLDKHFLLLNQSKITINEIQQVWRAIKSMTIKNRPTVSASALEIARHAGWDESKKGVEPRVRSALSALEQAGYIKRKTNSPRVFATGVLVKSYIEASEKIDKSPLFYDEIDRTVAKRIIKKIISARATSIVDGDAESRVDYISDDLGIPRMEVEEAISRMRQEQILADSMDLNAYIKKNEETRTTNVIAKFARLERYMLENIFKYEGKFDLKEFNDKAIKDGIKDTSVKNIRTILFYWSIKGLVKFKRENNIYQIIPEYPINKIKEKCDRKLVLAERIATYLFKLAKNGKKEEELVEFSLLELMAVLKDSGSLLESDSDFDFKDVEDALLYLSKIDAINLEGGFIVLYNMLNLERIITDNHISYKKDDYKELANYYKMKTQQIHIVGEFANMMLRNYDDALAYVKDYFNLEYDVFLKKYFKGKEKTGEIIRNITPKKYNLLFGNLSSIQKRIIDDDDSQFITVIAGPGSGKTRVLVHKLASLLLLEDIKSEQLLMLTFSRSAAREFKNRLIELVGDAAYYVDIKTFHSYCFDLLGKLGNEEEFDDVVKTATEMINSVEVEEDKISKAVLVIDEAQDMDQDEYDLIKSLIRRNPEMKIIAVGDDDQNIYEFRGSNSKYLQSLISDYNATKYEMIENYRSRDRIVQLSNLFARTIRRRIKMGDIVSMVSAGGSGDVQITEHNSTNLELPICRDYCKRKLPGSTAILTMTNDSALKIVGILVKKGIDARLIQSDDNINLYNLAEFRAFIGLISKCDSPVVDDAYWNECKEAFKNRYQGSVILSKVLKIIETFEKENKIKYKNDFVSYVNESNFDDFETYENSQVVVSTIHKAKGREFENVFMLLDASYYSKDEEKRRVYVGLTRAKSNLFIHIVGDSFRWVKERLRVKYSVDDKEYNEPSQMEIQLGFHDVFLGFFKNYKSQILALRSGNSLGFKSEYLTSNGKSILKYSMAFQEKLASIISRGYSITKSEIRYILAWKDKDHPEEDEIAVILPNLYLKKNADDKEEIMLDKMQEDESLKVIEAVNDFKKIESNTCDQNDYVSKEDNNVLIERVCEYCEKYSDYIRFHDGKDKKAFIKKGKSWHWFWIDCINGSFNYHFAHKDKLNILLLNNENITKIFAIIDDLIANHYKSGKKTLIKSDQEKESKASKEKLGKLREQIITESTIGSFIGKRVEETQLFKDLRRWRTAKAKELGVFAFVILSDNAMAQVVLNLPMDMNELMELHGFGKNNCAQYGEQILEIVRKYR